MEHHDPIEIAGTRQPFDFFDFAPFNGAALSVFHGDGVEASEWEIHRDTDELLFVLRGSATVEILTERSSELVDLTAGQLVVVPQGHWHRHRDVRDLVELYFTPGSSEQSDLDDPR